MDQNYLISAKPSLVGSPLIPKFRKSYNTFHKQSKQNICYLPKQISNFISTKTLPKYSDINQCILLSKNIQNKTQSCKQNLSPFIIDHHNIENNTRKKYQSHHRNTNLHQYELQINKDQPNNNLYHPQKPTCISNQQSNIDSVCFKMSQSIIVPSNTLQQRSITLSQNCFQKIRFLGNGKFGQVYLAKHKATGFVCAMKIIKKSIIREEKIQPQIAKQLRIHSKLRAMNIIQFYGFFDDSQNFYILLEFATEESVFSKLKGRNRLQQSQIQPLIKGLCDGIRYIHRMGYVHRDIKPENIVLQFGIPKICDFGWATDCNNIQLCKSYCGTPLYISPQLVRKQLYGTSVDIWAVGLLVYQLLVGRVPFSIWNEQDMNQMLTKQLQFPQYIDRTSNCQQFIRKCLQKQPIIRIQINQALKHPFLNYQIKQQINYQFYQQIHQILHNYY